MKRYLGGLALLVGIALASRGWISVDPLMFHLGLGASAAGLLAISLVAVGGGRSNAVFVLNTLACMLIGIILVDRVWFPMDRGRREQTATYSFVAAGGDPEAFVLHHQRQLQEQKRTRGNIMPDPRGVNPHVLRPGPGKYMESTWLVNSRGFRGPEISAEKGGRYRIVALGESTTFGATLLAQDRPWPEVLQQRIASELDCAKSVEVINAGIPGWSLANNLARLDADILPLEPDLILSYHGYNGFGYLVAQIPSARVGKFPEAPPRPSTLLSRVESALRVGWFRRRYDAARSIDERVLETDVHLSRYAELYRKLIFEVQAKGVGLALATFSMAVNTESAEDVIAFYEPVFPDLRARILANRLHSLLVRQVGEKHGVPVIDTMEGLDGAYQDAFIDPIHFTQTGRERLADHMLNGLRATLSAAPASCRERAPD